MIDITSVLLSALQHRALVELVERHLGRPASREAGSTESRYRRFEQQLKARRFVVPFVGVQGSGKSTLLNALLFGEPILPIDADETTCVPIELRWSDSLDIQARVVFADGTERRIVPSEEGLSAWVHNQSNPGNRHNVDRVIIETRHSLLADGLVLVDLPGTGSLTAANQATTTRYLEEAVGVVFVLRTVPPLTRSEALFVALQWSRLRSAMFVQNRWNDETDAEAESGREHNVSVLRELADRHRIPRASDGPEVYVVNGYQAFKGALTADAHLIAESGLGAFCDRVAVTAKEWPAELDSSIRAALLADLQAVAASCQQSIDQANRSSAEIEEDMRTEGERFARYIRRVDDRREAASTRIARFVAEFDAVVGIWRENQAGELRNRMREKLRAGIVDGPRLDRALTQEQTVAAEALIEKVQELATVLLDDLRRQCSDLSAWACDRTFSLHGIGSEERRKWEAAAGPAFGSAAAAAGGVIGAMLGGPIGGMLGGLLGALIGAWVGDKARKKVTESRADKTEPAVFEAIDGFLSSHSESVRADVYRMVDRTVADLDRWTAQQKADFERTQAASAATKSASVAKRRDQAAIATHDLAQCQMFLERLSSGSVSRWTCP